MLKELPTCDHVFVRVDKVSTPLAAKYKGTYKVLECTDKAFHIVYGIDEHGNELKDWVSMDRLKPLHVDDAVYRPDGAQAPAPARRGRGRPKG